MRFDFCIGNPPYQGDNHQQLYPDFFQGAKDIAGCIEMIFPIGWQEPKNANNLSKLNTKEVKEDKQIVLINNVQNVFPKVSGAEWTNVIIWKKGYDNGLDGKQKVYVNGVNERIVHLHYDRNQIEKPLEFITLYEYVLRYGKFSSISLITSSRKPYGLSTDVIRDATKYGLQPLQDKKLCDTDIKIYGTRVVKYVPLNYDFPKKENLNKYKVFIPYAWGAMDGNKYFGGSYSDIIIGYPNEACTETYLESGSFDNYQTVKKHAKYLLTKFLRALLYLNKFSRHSTTAWASVPVQDYHEDFWNGTIAEIDVALMDKYNVPNNIRQFVFANIQTKTEANIVNFNGI